MFKGHCDFMQSMGHLQCIILYSHTGAAQDPLWHSRIILNHVQGLLTWFATIVMFLVYSHKCKRRFRELCQFDQPYQVLPWDGMRILSAVKFGQKQFLT